jgi:hypothetical protein
MGMQTIDGYSSTVEIFLTVNGEQLRVAQIGPDTLILREPRDIRPSTEATLTISIDGRIEEERIILPSGSSRDAVITRYF